MRDLLTRMVQAILDLMNRYPELGLRPPEAGRLLAQAGEGRR